MDEFDQNILAYFMEQVAVFLLLNPNLYMIMAKFAKLNFGPTSFINVLG